MTAYTKQSDVTTVYGEVADVSPSYTKQGDQYTQLSPIGGLLHLATEGSRIPLVSEDRSIYIVVSKGSEGINYTKGADVSTAYTKVLDV